METMPRLCVKNTFLEIDDSDFGANDGDVPIDGRWLRQQSEPAPVLRYFREEDDLSSSDGDGSSADDASSDKGDRQTKDQIDRLASISTTDESLDELDSPKASVDTSPRREIDVEALSTTNPWGQGDCGAQQMCFAMIPMCMCCGTYVSASFKFCVWCGVSLQASPSPSGANPQASSS
eukprot:TRINITY_DN2810_c0_g1_i1.p1 TRINITY_DN2810_c0_g1~~TRINITY_DN2810_c0_g1_i1.p1  ORF type:complete len:178 (+),score=33.82 TRINITY_DN2810_c0_g1_i1:103-636(+)